MTLKCHVFWVILKQKTREEQAGHPSHVGHDADGQLLTDVADRTQTDKFNISLPFEGQVRFRYIPGEE